MAKKFWKSAPSNWKEQAELNDRLKQQQMEETAFGADTPSTVSQMLRTGRVMPSQPARTITGQKPGQPTPTQGGFNVARPSQPRIVRQPAEEPQEGPNPFQKAGARFREHARGGPAGIAFGMLGDVANPILSGYQTNVLEPSMGTFGNAPSEAEAIGRAREAARSRASGMGSIFTQKPTELSPEPSPGTLTALLKRAQEVGAGQAWAESGQRWRDLPEDFPGQKGIAEALFAPTEIVMNAVPVGKVAQITGKGAKVLGKAGQQAGKAYVKGLIQTAPRLVQERVTLASKAPKGAKPSPVTQTAKSSLDATYDAARETARKASRDFRAIQTDYRAKKIGDAEFLKGKAAFDQSTEAFDNAETAYIAAKNAEAKAPDLAAKAKGAESLTAKPTVKELQTKLAGQLAEVERGQIEQAAKNPYWEEIMVSSRKTPKEQESLRARILARRAELLSEPAAESVGAKGAVPTVPPSPARAPQVAASEPRIPPGPFKEGDVYPSLEGANFPEGAPIETVEGAGEKVMPPFGPAAGKSPTVPPTGAPPSGVVTAQPVIPPTQAGRTFLGELRPFKQVMDEVVTSDNPVVRTIFGKSGINPSILQNSEVGRATVAYQRGLVAIDEMVDTAVTAALDTHAQRVTGRTRLAINKDGLMTVDNVPWQDVFSKPDKYPHPELKGYIDDFHKVIAETTQMLDDAGLPPPRMALGEGEFYVPRYVKTKRGIELRRPSNTRLNRYYEEAADGFAKGIRYDRSPRATAELHIKTAYHQILEKQLSDALEPYSITAKQLLPQPVKDAMVAAVNKRIAAERATRSAKAEKTRWLKAHEKELPGVLTPRKKANLDALDKAIEDAKKAEDIAKRDYAIQKIKYSKAMDGAKKSETGPGYLFGRQEKEIPIAVWRNRFFPREDQQKLTEALGVFGGSKRKANFAARGIDTVANYTRFLAAVGDFAEPFIQGLPVLATNPKAWAKSAALHYTAFFDPTVQSRFVKSHIDTFKWMAEHGVPIGDPEFFAVMKKGGGVSPGVLLEKLPKGFEARSALNTIGQQTFGRFQATYNTGLGTSRAFLVEALKPTWKGTDAELAAYIRNLTGGLDSRAIGVGPNQRAVEGAWLAFSPRLLRSTVALTADAMRPNTPRGQASLKTLMKLAAGTTAIYVLTGMALGKSKEDILRGLNPLEGKKFLSHEINGDWIGVGGQIRAMTQLAANMASTLAPGGRPVEDLWSTNLQDNPISNFYMSRGAPALNIAGGAVEATTGLDVLPYKDLDGLPDLAKHIGTSAIPFTTQAIGEGQQPFTVSAAFTGWRTSAATVTEKLAKAAHEKGIAAGRDWKDFEPWEKEEALKQNPALEKQRIEQMGHKGQSQTERIDVERYDMEDALSSEYQQGMVKVDELRKRYAEIQGETAAKYAQLNKDFKLWAETEKMPTDPNKRAIVEYYKVFDDSTLPSGVFDYNLSDTLMAQVEKQWTPEQKAYVDRNTKISRHPPVIQEYLRAKESLKPYFDIPDQVMAQMGNRKVKLDSGGFTTIKMYMELTDQLERQAEEAANKGDLVTRDKNLAAAKARKAGNVYKAVRDAVVKLQNEYRKAHPEADALLYTWYGLTPKWKYQAQATPQPVVPQTGKVLATAGTLIR